jgi:hypothetical protein
MSAFVDGHHSLWAFRSRNARMDKLFTKCKARFGHFTDEVRPSSSDRSMAWIEFLRDDSERISRICLRSILLAGRSEAVDKESLELMLRIRRNVYIE